MSEVSAITFAIAVIVLLPVVWRVSEDAGRRFGDWISERFPHYGEDKP